MPSPDPPPTRSPELPAWFEAGDPWLTDKMRIAAEIAAAEHQLGPETEKALALFLRSAHTRLLQLLPGALTAQAGLDDWPDRDSVWRAAFVKYVVPVLRQLFAARFRRKLRVKVRIDPEALIEDYLDQVWSSLQTWPDDLFAEVNADYQQALADGLDERAALGRAAESLRIDAYSKRVQAEVERLRETVRNRGTRAGVRRQARARLSIIAKRGHRGDMRWWPMVAEITRSYAVSVLNAALAAAAEQDPPAERRYKMWVSVEDNRVRPAHEIADGQVREVGDMFTVGGFYMRYPGDPVAPPDLVRNCRCSLLLISPARAKTAMARYERDLPARAARLGARTDGQRFAVVANHGGVTGGVAGFTKDAPELVVPLTKAKANLDTFAALTSPEVSTVDTAVAEPDVQRAQWWSGPIAPLNKPSPDGRMLAVPEDGQPLHRTLPLPVLWQEVTADGHDAARIVGNILSVWIENDTVHGKGTFDLGNPHAREIVRQIREGYHRWVSITHDPDATYEIQYYRNGAEIPEDELAALMDSDEPAEDVTSVRVASNWRLTDVTIVANPAFDEAAINLLTEEEATGSQEDAPAIAPAVAAAAVEPNRNEQKQDTMDETTGQTTDQIPAETDTDDEVFSIDWSFVDSDDEEFDLNDERFAAPTAEKRNRAEGSGAAMEGGRFPIESRADLLKAIRAVGRARPNTDAERAKVRKHIMSRAKSLGLTSLIPDSWNSDGSIGDSTSNATTNKSDKKKPPAKSDAKNDSKDDANDESGGQEEEDANLPPWLKKKNGGKNGGKSTKSAVLADADAAKTAWCERVAAAVPLEPPRSWFADPQLTGPVKVRVTDEGRVYGHIAKWNSTHAARPGVVPPRSPSYGKFHRHPVRTSDGERVLTGPLAANGHASLEEPSIAAVMSHYDNAQFVVADVVCGEDQHGIWVSGALRAGITPLQVLMTDRYSFSGDWRNRNELVAACASVAVPGFHLAEDPSVKALAASAAAMPEVMPVVADGTARVRVEDGEVVALVAAGMLPADTDVRADTVGRVPDPEDWGRRAGRALHAGMREAELAARAELEAAERREAQLAARAERVAQLRRRVDAPRYARVEALRRRVVA